MMGSNTEQLDLLIIGAGPAGISAAYAAKVEGLNYLVIERGLLAHTIYNYPVGLPVFSTPDELEMLPGTLELARDKPTREELLAHYVRFILEQNLRINTEEEALELKHDDGESFSVRTTRSQYRAMRVLVAVGAMSRLRRLNVPGEDLPKVQHRFVEPFPFVRKDALVIGGGNSAAEAALFLAEGGARTTLAIWPSDWENRDPKAGAIKAWVRTPLEREIKENRLQIVLFKRIEEITEREVRIETEEEARLLLPNDAVFILIGSDADLMLLRQAGVEIVRSERGCDVPVYDQETFETNVRGIYVAGHFTNARHIKDAIAVPRRIVPLIAQSLRAAAV
ncbi:MAG: NAD(P)-binding domain-containing protein [Pyrinomonadaceae bacterium]|nr:NAD(P)-binding domain-containing protein [Pyrinomonadaceae bacterium]